MESNLMPQQPLQLKALMVKYQVERFIWLRVMPDSKYVELKFTDCILGYEYLGEVWEADPMVFYGRCQIAWVLEIT